MADPIIPNQHFQFLGEQRTAERQQSLLNQEQINNMIVSQEVNKAFGEYTKEKDPQKFTQRMRTLGHLFGNQKLQSFEVPEYMGQMGTPVYTVDDQGKLRQAGRVPKGAQIRNKVKVDDSDRFTQAVQSGMGANDLYRNFPQYADKIDALRMSGAVTDGMSQQAPQMPQAPQTPQGAGMGQQPMPQMPQMSMAPASPMGSQQTPSAQPGNDQYQYVPEYDGLGRVTGYKTIANKDYQKPDEVQAQQKQTEMVLSSAKDTIDTINQIEQGLKYFGAAGNIPALPGEYNKVDWQANLDKLRSNLVVDLMNQMKQASKTGATGFGQLSNKELNLLQNAATALKKGMSEQDAQRYLNQIKEKALKVMSGAGQQQMQGGQGGGSPFSYLWQ